VSGVFDLDTDGQTSLDEEARLNPLDASQAAPGFWTGTGRGTGLGVMRGGARVAQALGMAAAAPLALYERATDQEGTFTDRYFKALDDYATSAVDYWTPAPAEVGKAGQVLGGLSEIVLPLMAGGGNPTLLLGAQGLGTSADLTRQGASNLGAIGVGTLQAAATGIGFKLPFLGSTLATRIASGVGGNLALGVGVTAAQRELLQAAGDAQLAEQYDPFDPTARAVDLLTGIVFGGIAHVGARGQPARRFTPEEVDATLTAANAKHFQLDTAPGRPLDDAAAVAHQRAMEAATDQLLRGEPVSVPREVADAAFAERARDPVELPDEFRPPAIDETAGRPVVPADAAVPPAPEPRAPGEGAPKAETAPATDGAAGRPVATDPDVIAAQRIVDTTDLEIPTGEIDADGAPVRRSARELMAAADQEIVQAQTEARGIEAAVTCFLQRGA
jgi:hypothetical protein